MSANILCAVDLSHDDLSTRLLHRAAQLAELDSATLNVITVLPDFGMSIVGSYFAAGAMEKAISDANAELHKLVEQALPDRSVRHITKIGPIYQEVLKAASDMEASLIVIGAHRPDFSDYFLGPNAARVVRHASASVLVVR